MLRRDAFPLELLDALVRAHLVDAPEPLERPTMRQIVSQRPARKLPPLAAELLCPKVAQAWFRAQMAVREPSVPPVLLRLALVSGELPVESPHALLLERSPALQGRLGEEQQADGPLAKPRVKSA